MVTAMISRIGTGGKKGKIETKNVIKKTKLEKKVIYSFMAGLLAS